MLLLVATRVSSSFLKSSKLDFVTFVCVCSMTCVRSLGGCDRLNYRLPAQAIRDMASFFLTKYSFFNVFISAANIHADDGQHYRMIGFLDKITGFPSGVRLCVFWPCEAVSLNAPGYL
jgi:hypothetical protein